MIEYNIVMSGIKDRIRQIIEHEGLTAAAFAERVGVAQATVSHILGSRNKYPSTDFFLRLHQCYPNIDLNWLLTGTGTSNDHTEASTNSLHPSEANLESKDESSWPDLGADNDYPLFAENAKIRPSAQQVAKKRKEIASRSSQNGPKETVPQEIVSPQRPPRKITEIRIFFDDNTYETLRPEK